MAKSSAAKIGLKPGGRALFVNVPVEVVEAMELPALAVQSTAEGSFDYIHLFVTSQQEMHEHFAGLKNHLNPTGMLWVS
ncbi:hypothetical protein [Spirosoma koreense]